MRQLQLAVLVLLGAGGAAGQGAERYEPDALLGASRAAAKLATQFAHSQAWKQAWRVAPAQACSNKAAASLCGSATHGLQELTQLNLAASPPAFSTHVVGPDTGGLRLQSPPENQEPCQACTAFAVAAAASSAMASVLRVDVGNTSISPQALLCSPDRKSVKACSAGDTLTAVLQQLVQWGPTLPTAACLPYTPDASGVLTAREQCTARCGPNKFARLGRFTSKRMTSMAEAQEHIRRYGSVVARFDVYSDLKPTFERAADALRVYKPAVPGNATFEFGHALALVGYNNSGRFWWCRNSWGTAFASGGFFRVDFGVVSPESGEVYGVSWVPFRTPRSRQLPAQLMPTRGGGQQRAASTDDARLPGCYAYRARRGDYAFGLASLAGISLPQFLLNNTDTISDLDMPLEGLELRLCQPMRDAIASEAEPSDPQLAALLAFKAYVDRGRTMATWTREGGSQEGYCFTFEGVRCSRGAPGSRQNVTELRLCKGAFASGVTQLAGVLPPAEVLLGLPALRKLWICDQKGLNYSLPEDWSALTGLVELILSNNSLSGTLPASWSSLRSLAVFNAQNNSLAGTLPPQWRSLSQLHTLDVSTNALTGTLPAEYSNLTRMRSFSVFENRLSGRLRPEWSAWSELEYYQSGRNRFTGTLPAAWSAWTQAQILFLNQNILSGTLPETWAGLQSLTTLLLFNNPITGTLPSAFSRLTRMKQLSLETTLVSGPLPDSWSAMQELEQLSLAGNTLNGTLPASWSSMSQLIYLVLGQNRLHGTVPASYGKLSNLRVLELADNLLSGTVPASWANLTKLRELSLARNAKLRGCMAARGFLKARSPIFDLRANVFDGTELNRTC